MPFVNTKTNVNARTNTPTAIINAALKLDIWPVGCDVGWVVVVTVGDSVGVGVVVCVGLGVVVGLTVEVGLGVAVG